MMKRETFVKKKAALAVMLAAVAWSCQLAGAEAGESVVDKYKASRLSEPLKIDYVQEEKIFADDFSKKMSRGTEPKIIKESVTDINLVVTDKGEFEGQGKCLWYPEQKLVLPPEGDRYLHISFSIHALEAKSSAPYEVSARFALAPLEEFEKGRTNPDESCPNINIVVLRNTAKNELRIGLREKSKASPYPYEGLGGVDAERYVCCVDEVRFPIKIDLFVNKGGYVVNVNRPVQELKGARTGKLEGFASALKDAPLASGIFLGGPHTPGASTQGVLLKEDKKTDRSTAPRMVIDDYEADYALLKKIDDNKKQPEKFVVSEHPEWKLVWGDEFDGDKVDESKWWVRESIEKQAGRPVCRKENTTLDGKGNLLMKFHYDKEQNAIFTGGIVSKPYKRYGYYEARIKLDTTGAECGWWSSFWMGDAYNPFIDGMEIDILEGSGNPEKKTASIGTTLHSNVYLTKNPKKSFTKHVEVPQPWDGFHVYGFKWTPLEMVFYVDGVETARWTCMDVITTRPYQIRLNCVEGKLEKASKRGTSITDYQVVDYVRVYDLEGMDKAPEIGIKGAKDNFPEQKKLGDSVEIEAKAAARAGSEIREALLFDNGYLLETISKPPYKFKVTFDDAYYRTKPYMTTKPNYGGIKTLEGNHVFAVLAQDSEGRVGVCDNPLIVQVNDKDFDPSKKSEPFKGEVLQLPGKLTLKNHDDGGLNVGYRKNEPEKEGEDGFRKGFGWTRSLDWAKYTVDVKKAGKYTVSAQILKHNLEERSGLALFCDGKRLCDLFVGGKIPDGKYWEASAKGVELPAGRHVISVMFISYFNTGTSIDFKLEE